MGIGERLREAREAQGYTIDDIQVKTKIQKRYLEAIEAEKYEALPGKFYARAFMKEYALTVGLDPNELLASFSESDLPERKEETVNYTERTRMSRASKEKTTSFLSYLPTVIVVLLVIGIVFVGIMLVKKANDAGDGLSNDGNTGNEVVKKVDNNNDDEGNENGNGNDDKTNEGNENEDEDETNEDKEQSFEVVEVGEGSVPLSEMNFNNPEEPITLKFETTADSYIDISDENEERFYIETIAGETTEELEITDQKRILLNIGYTETMTIYINDIELEYPEDTGSTHHKIWVNFVTE